MTSWQKLVEPIRNDREHGASQLYLKLLALLKEYIDSHDPNTLEPSELAALIAAVRPEMAPFQYAANKIRAIVSLADRRETLQRLLYSIRELRAEVADAASAIAPSLQERIGDRSAIMLHSYSATLKECILAAADRNSRIHLSYAEPASEGVRLAEELRKARFSVENYPDDEILHHVPRVDAVVVGADWIAEEYFVNKVGTKAIALAARESSIPLYVVSDLTKLVPARYRASNSAGKSEELFEEVPNELVSAFLLPDGAYSAGEIAIRLQRPSL